jgi:polyhydroxybutyrate depolymerase
MPMIAYLLIFVLSCSIISCDKTEPDTDIPVLHFYDSIVVEEKTRSYLLNLPTNYNAGNNFPLVVALHGFGGKASQMEHDYKLSEKSNEAQFVIVYPEGTKSDGPLGLQSWNAGTCCEAALEQQVNDVGFISQLIQKLVRQFKINPKKVYVTGISNGAMLTYRLACEIPNQIAAIASVSGPLLTTRPCQPSRKMPILHIHSLIDTKVPYAGGIGIGGYYYPPADSALQVWSAINGCNASPRLVFDSTLYTKTQYISCAAGTTIELNLTKDGGHSWPGGLQPRPGADEPSKAFDATNMIWKFFQQYELP